MPAQTSSESRAASLKLAARAGLGFAVLTVALAGCGDGEASGDRFRDALERAATDGSLEGAGRELASLTDFQWDKLEVLPPYSEALVPKIAPDSDENEIEPIPEFSAAFVFVHDRKVAAWTFIELTEPNDLKLNTKCLLIDEPIPNAGTKVAIRANKSGADTLVFTNPSTGKPLRPRASRTCPE